VRVIEGIAGTKLAGPFLVERWLGEGGMGIVFEAPAEARGERVAEDARPDGRRRRHNFNSIQKRGKNHVRN
jgi:hypothetical protein